MTALPQIITNSASSKGQNINSRSRQESRSHSVPGQKLGSGELVSRSSRSGRRGRIGMPLAPGALWDCLSQTWCVTWRRRSKPSHTQVPTSNLTEDNRKKHCKPNETKFQHIPNLVCRATGRGGENKQIGHHARPSRASATAPL